MARMQAKTADAAGMTHSMRLWLTTQPAKKKYIASSTCVYIFSSIQKLHIGLKNLLLATCQHLRRPSEDQMLTWSTCLTSCLTFRTALQHNLVRHAPRSFSANLQQRKVLWLWGACLGDRVCRGIALGSSMLGKLLRGGGLQRGGGHALRLCCLVPADLEIVDVLGIKSRLAVCKVEPAARAAADSAHKHTCRSCQDASNSWRSCFAGRHSNDRSCQTAMSSDTIQDNLSFDI